MPVSSTLAALQESMLDACKASALAQGQKMPTDRQLADVAGVDASIVSHWRAGRREIGLAEIVRLGDRYGADVIACLGERFGRAVRPSPREAIPLAIGATAATATFTAAVHAALADGRLTDEEAEGLQQQHDQAVAQLHRSMMAITATRRAS